MTPALRFGMPVHIVLDGVETTGVFAGVADRRHGRVRIGHRVRTVALADIRKIGSAASDRWWAELLARTCS